MIRKHFKKNHLPDLAKQLEKIWFPILYKVTNRKNDALTQEQRQLMWRMNRLFRLPTKKLCGL